MGATSGNEIDQPSLPPVAGDEDKERLESTIKYLVRLRKRQAANNGDVSLLGDAIDALNDFGRIKDFWR